MGDFPKGGKLSYKKDKGGTSFARHNTNHRPTSNQVYTTCYLLVFTFVPFIRRSLSTQQKERNGYFAPPFITKNILSSRHRHQANHEVNPPLYCVSELGMLHGIK